MSDTKTVLVLPEDVGELEDLYWSSVRWIKKYGGREIVLRWRQHYWHEGTGENGDVSTWFVPVREDEVVWVEVGNEV